MKRDKFATELAKLNNRQLEAFEDFLDSYLPNDPLNPVYSETLFNKFYELPDAMKWAAYVEFLKDREILKDYEFNFNIITDNFK